LAGGGTVLVSNSAARLTAGTTLLLRGATLDPTKGAVVEVGSAGSTASSAVVIDTGKTMTGYGTVASAVSDNGTLLAQGGMLTVAGRVSGTGNVVVGAGASLLSQTALSEAGLQFGGGNATVEVAKSTTIAAITTISSIGATDTIDFLGTVATSLTFAGGKLRVVGSGGTIASLSFAGNYSVSNFKISSDGAGGTDLTTVGLATPTAANLAALARLHGTVRDFENLRLGVSIASSSAVGSASATYNASSHAVNWITLHHSV
jgi:hypothetical protein